MLGICIGIRDFVGRTAADKVIKKAASKVILRRLLKTITIIFT
jgi:hypothetical protein